MADTMDYKSFREAILKDFDNNLSGLEIELSKIISNKFGDVKLNPTQLRGAIKDALQVAVRDIKGDEVDKISLTDFIDDDPKVLENKLKSSSKEISQYIPKLLFHCTHSFFSIITLMMLIFVWPFLFLFVISHINDDRRVNPLLSFLLMLT